MTYLLMIVGFGLLIIGGELLVKYSSRLAAILKVSPLVIGLTVVAMGTSAPELSVSIISALNGKADIALGNVVGSNIFNVLFILGVSALFAPLVVAQRLIRWDVPIMIVVSILVYLFSWSGFIERGEGLFLSLGLIAFTILVIKTSPKESKEVKSEYEKEFGEKDTFKPNLFGPSILILISLGLLVLGSRWFVDGAVAVARVFGVSELIIGLTIVAAGTSMPEVFASIIATRRGELDIAVGNVVGSNIFNILGVLGISSLIPTEGIAVSPVAISFDIPVMVAVAVACLPIFFTGHKISRWEGAVFLFYYAAYTGFLILDAKKHDTLPIFSGILFWFVIPLTILTLGIGVWRYRKEQLAKA